MDGDRPTVLFSEDGMTVLTSVPGFPEGDSVRSMLATVAMLLRRVRLNKDLTAVTVADWCGVSQSVLCRVELGRRVPHLPLVLSVCNVLGVRFSDVIRMAEDEAFPLGGTPWTAYPERLLAASPIVIVSERGGA